MTKLIDGNIFIDKDEADRSMNILGDRLREVRSQCDKLQAEITKERKVYSEMVAAIIVATGVNIPAGGITAIEAVNKLRTENERLRVALEAISEYNHASRQPAEIARKALSGAK